MLNFQNIRYLGSNYPEALPTEQEVPENPFLFFLGLWYDGLEGSVGRAGGKDGYQVSS